MRTAGQGPRQLSLGEPCVVKEESAFCSEAEISFLLEKHYLKNSTLLVKKDLLTHTLSKEQENTSPQRNGPGPLAAKVCRNRGWTERLMGREAGVQKLREAEGGWGGPS